MFGMFGMLGMLGMSLISHFFTSCKIVILIIVFPFSSILLDTDGHIKLTGKSHDCHMIVM